MVSSDGAGEAAWSGPWVLTGADLAAAVGSAERRREWWRFFPLRGSSEEAAAAEAAFTGCAWDLAESRLLR